MVAGAVEEALRAFLATLDSYTLADLVQPRSALSALLRVGVATEAGTTGEPRPA